MALPDSWGEWVLSGVISTATAIIAWVSKRLFGRMRDHDQRLATLERVAAVSDFRHSANVERLDRIDERSERIEDKLDRLIERL